ncbi:hypothetical protein C3B55_00932 [Candidatus Pseudomonas adelgestsugas]|uniref:Uncharacterized protein n=1 Tax=Candidatus Pseudomonas adelgestsugas TaxID=1302376 RepID=A0ABX5R9C9_9PSED|nr:hypothetical protein C3B55_00932 [Candidatus Pseudomonas adelgestsugas]
MRRIDSHAEDFARPCDLVFFGKTLIDVAYASYYAYLYVSDTL